jgi:2-polyprenyl-3-methyl-5-hydroxy-6-metoxy-1,4-benzoquinol methylase
MADFPARVIPSLLRKGLRVLDVGGGRTPCIPPRLAAAYGLHVTGLDLAEDELLKAEPGSYADRIIGDVATVPIPGSFDLILSRTVLEHVKDNRSAIRNLAASLADGGVMAHLVPCRYAPYAIVNRLLGNRLARRLLWTIYPTHAGVSGFQAYYDRCLPTQMAALCLANGLEVAELTPHFVSDYCRFFAPAHILDLCRQRLMQKTGIANLAETFIIVARKPSKRTSDNASGPPAKAA